jgi:uncharacterized protein DUF3293
MSRRQDLEAAYRATTYRVAAPGGAIDLRVAAGSAALDSLLARHGASCWAYLTAVNPASQPLSAVDNERRQGALHAALAGDGYHSLAGEAIADAGDWPSEPGFLVLGMAREPAIRLAARFGQNALLWGEHGGAATLVWVGEVI